MLKISILLILTTPIAFALDSARDETQVWNLEKAYWEYVKANDLEKYRALWHEDFVGWPTSSSTPLRKDHITDWITKNTSKGVKLQSYAIEQLAIKVTGDVAIDHLPDQNGLGWPRPDRIEHRSYSDHPHVDQDRQHMADHRRHVCACEC